MRVKGDNDMDYARKNDQPGDEGSDSDRRKQRRCHSEHAQTDQRDAQRMVKVEARRTRLEEFCAIEASSTDGASLRNRIRDAIFGGKRETAWRVSL